MEVIIVYDGEMPLGKLFIIQHRTTAPLEQWRVAKKSGPRKLTVPLFFVFAADNYENAFRTFSKKDLFAFFSSSFGTMCSLDESSLSNSFSLALSFVGTHT